MMSLITRGLQRFLIASVCRLDSIFRRLVSPYFLQHFFKRFACLTNASDPLQLNRECVRPPPKTPRGGLSAIQVSHSIVCGFPESQYPAL
jgi:hypothetical protein